VDGFRLDAVDFLLHDPALRSNPPAPPGTIPVKLFGMQCHMHDMLQPEVLGVMARIRGLMEQYPGTVTLGEISSQPGAFGRVVACTDGIGQLHMAYTLQPLRGGFDWPTVTTLLREIAANGKHGWICWSFSNHDVERAISRWNPRRGEAPPEPAFARLLMALLLSLRGSVCLYQGEELGLTEANLREADLCDPFGIAYWPEFRGRDGSRTPMPWCAEAPHAGFTTGDRPWLPVPPPHRALAVDAQEADEASLLQAYRRFLLWRRSIPALRYGKLSTLPLQEPLVGFTRTYEVQRVLVVFNLSDRPVPLDLAAFGRLTVLAESGFADPGDRLGPFGVVFARIDGGYSRLPES
jgi:alpha-glucosidase